MTKDMIIYNHRDKEREVIKMTKKAIIEEGIHRGFWADTENNRKALMKWSKTLLEGQLESKIKLQTWRRANGWRV